MNKQSLFDFIRNYDESYYGYNAESAMQGAREAGLVDDFELVNVEEIDRLSQGRVVQFVFELFNISEFIAINVYVMDEPEYGEDIFKHVYQVEPYTVTITKYRPVYINVGKKKNDS